MQNLSNQKKVTVEDIFDAFDENSKNFEAFRKSLGFTKNGGDIVTIFHILSECSGDSLKLSDEAKKVLKASNWFMAMVDKLIACINTLSMKIGSYLYKSGYEDGSSLFKACDTVFNCTMPAAKRGFIKSFCDDIEQQREKNSKLSEEQIFSTIM